MGFFGNCVAVHMNVTGVDWNGHEWTGVDWSGHFFVKVPLDEFWEILNQGTTTLAQAECYERGFLTQRRHDAKARRSHGRISNRRFEISNQQALDRPSQNIWRVIGTGSG